MKLFFRFLLVFLVSFHFSFGKNISFNATADRLFTDSAYSTIIYNQCLLLSKNKGVSTVDFNSNYANLKDSIIILLQPAIDKKFEAAEKKIKTSKLNDRLAFILFERELRNTVSTFLTEPNGIQQALLQKDLNDRILSFDSKIKIDPDGKINVTETITIANFNNESYNNKIKRGITRDFPTKYENKYGLIVNVPFDLISITRNGESEQWHSEKLTNGTRVYCGRSDHFLEEGIHKYVIRYTTNNQLKFHNDRDEFYWNVTGNGWEFSIDKASCKIEFPKNSEITDMSCYTGFQGDKSSECNANQKGKNIAEFHTNKRLMQYQGLTVSTSVRKGILAEKKQLENYIQLVKDNKFLFGLLLIILIVIVMLYRHWRSVGRDPEQGVIIPTFNPPGKMSPAEVGYLYFQAYNNKLFAAALIDLAVQNKLHIDVDKEGLIFKDTVYKFSAPKNQSKNPERDYNAYDKYGFDADQLFGMEIKTGEYNAGFRGIVSSFTSHIGSKILTEKSRDKKGFLALNQGYIGAGLFVLIMLTIASIIYFSIAKPPIFTIVYIILLLVIGFAFQIFFMVIIKALTPAGRAMADQILGFKMYLETTDKNILDKLNPPEENIQLFEKYLPYAIALGIENRWSDKFKTIIEKSLADGYQPTYYSVGGHYAFSSGSQSFASTLSSGLSQTISSASTPPSSTGSGSGGSFGGGSSGGGGGGGGGGGW